MSNKPSGSINDLFTCSLNGSITMIYKLPEYLQYDIFNFSFKIFY